MGGEEGEERERKVEKIERDEKGKIGLEKLKCSNRGLRELVEGQNREGS
jgi:hypothetical protein